MARVIEQPEALILQTAKAILATNGYKKLSMRAVSQAGGIAIGTIYNYFPTKQDLIAALMTDYWQGYMQVVRVIAASEAPAEDKLARIYDELGPFFRQFQAEWLTSDFRHVADDTAKSLQAESRFLSDIIAVIEDVLVLAEQGEGLRTKQSVSATARFIMQNFIAMVQMPMFTYAAFVPFLHEMFDPISKQK